MVGVDRNVETQPLEAFLALGAQDDAAVDGLVRGADLDAIADPHGCRQRAVTQVARRVARVLAGVGERERAGGTNDPLEYQRLGAGAVSALTPRSYARRRMGSASSSRPSSRRKFTHSRAASPIRIACAGLVTMHRETSRERMNSGALFGAVEVSEGGQRVARMVDRTLGVTVEGGKPRLADAEHAEVGRLWVRAEQVLRGNEMLFRGGGVRSAELGAGGGQVRTRQGHRVVGRLEQRDRTADVFERSGRAALENVQTGERPIEADAGIWIGLVVGVGQRLPYDPRGFVVVALIR